MMINLVWTVSLLLLVLNGCTVMPERSPLPAPVVKSTDEPASTASAPEEEPDIRVRAYEPAPVVTAQPVHSGAVVALLDTAERQHHSGDISGAVATTERALRIEPRNAHLWNRLAHLRHAQKRYALAVEIAEKSNALAAGDLSLKRDNWRLIADCRRVSGDRDGAARAERKARMLR